MSKTGYQLGEYSGCVYGVVADEEVASGRGAARKVLKNALKEAYERVGYDPEAVADYLFTSTFRREPSRALRYNSLLHAGNAVGYPLPKLMAKAIDGANAALPNGTPADGARLLRELILSPGDAIAGDGEVHFGALLKALRKD